MGLVMLASTRAREMRPSLRSQLPFICTHRYLRCLSFNSRLSGAPASIPLHLFSQLFAHLFCCFCSMSSSVSLAICHGLWHVANKGCNGSGRHLRLKGERFVCVREHAHARGSGGILRQKNLAN